jgi:hypothetical protein
MQIFMPPLALLSLLLLSPALVLSALLQLGVFSPSLTLNSDSMILNLLANVFPPMLDPSARSQFRAICYRQISARIGQAVAKATVMRLLPLP